MKKRTSKLLSLLLTLTMVLGMLPAMGQVAYAAGDVEINATNFPDANFRTFVKTYDTDSNSYLSEAELAAVTEMDCHGKEIADLTGIEHFTALTRLDCWENKLTTLDVSKNTNLKWLYCYGNNLTTLDVSAVPALKDAVENGTKDTSNSDYDNYSSSKGTLRVDKGFSNIITDTSSLGIAINATNFPDANFRTFVKTYDTDSNGYLSEAELAAVTKMNCVAKDIADLTGIEHFTALTVLDCYDNKLTTLDVNNNTALTELYCYNNQLTSLDVSKNTALTYLDCGTNQLTALDVSANIALTYVRCTDNQLTSLDVSKNTALTMLYCSNNQLTTLDVSKNTQLTTLWCSGNQLTTLDVSANTALTYLWCYNNQLTTLDVSKNTNLKWLHCYGNNLTMLDVSAVPALKDAKENGTKDTSNSDYDNYSSSQGTLRVDKGFTNIITDAPADAATEYPVWVGGTQVTDANKDDILGDGKVSYTPGEGSGTLTITGTPAITGLVEGTLIYADGIDLTINAASGLMLNSTGSGVYVNGDVTINGDASINTTGISINCRGDVTITGSLTATAGGTYTVFSNGNISIGGNVNVENTLESGDGLRASSGNISIGGDAKVTAGAYALYSGNGSVTINDDADLTTGINGYPVYSWKDVTITGNLTAETSSYYIIYVNNGGNISIGGSVDAKTTNANGDGLRTPNGKITMTSGVWDITAGNYAFYAKNGIEIPSTHEVTLPDGGEINQVTVDDNTFYTVTEADGSNVAAHAVIEPKAVTYTVSFDANGGTGSMADATGVSGDYVLPVCSFTAPNGKQFKAWSVGGVEKTAGATITVNANTTVTAVWENIPVTYYTVTFDSAGGSAVTAQTIEAGQKATKPADPTKSGYDFKGWTLNGSAYDFNTAVNGDITLVATWEQQQVVPTTRTVTVNGSYASTTGAGEYEAGETVTIYAGSRIGYTFDGWTSSDVTITNAGSKTATFVMPDHDVTVTATWDKNSTGGGVVIPTVFPVNVKDSDNGEVEASAKYAVPGSTVKLTVTPDEGYELDTLIVKSGSKFINVTEKNGKYQFVMPFGSATVTATFKAVNPYNDVDTDDWFYDDVLYVTLKDLMNGTDNGKFSPEITTDRAMLVTVLWRLEGCPVVDSPVAFDDVADGLWYSDAIDWASANGIVNGYGVGKFGPTDQITREQIAAILNRYAAYKNWTDGTALPMIPQYNCSIWAENNVIWADMNGLLNGLGVDITDMTAKASRAELAAYLARFMQNIVK